MQLSENSFVYSARVFVFNNKDGLITREVELYSVKFIKFVVQLKWYAKWNFNN